MEPIILVGGGGHCISCIDVINLQGKYNIVGIIDKPEKLGDAILGIEVIGSDNDIPELIKNCKNFLITIGQIKNSELRKRIFKLIKSNGGDLPVIVSPNAYISPSASLEEGTIVMHNVLVNALVSIGKNCIINSGALIEHEVQIGDFCHISTHAAINGQVKIDSNCFVGSNAVIINNVNITSQTIIGAGSCVSNSLMESGTYIGNPARKA